MSDILRTSRKNNPRFDVTGILVCNLDFFLQVLEGPEASIKALYANILNDHRHQGITLIANSPIEKREFGNWSMAFSEYNDDYNTVNSPDWTQFGQESALAICHTEMVRLRKLLN